MLSAPGWLGSMMRGKPGGNSRSAAPQDVKRATRNASTCAGGKGETGACPVQMTQGAAVLHLVLVRAQWHTRAEQY